MKTSGGSNKQLFTYEVLVKNNKLTDVNLLLVAGKIVSVEARHAAAIRDLLNPKSADFAGDNAVDANGLDGSTQHFRWH